MKTREVLFLFEGRDGETGEVRFMSGKYEGSLWAEAYTRAHQQLNTGQGERVVKLEMVKQ